MIDQFSPYQPIQFLDGLLGIAFGYGLADAGVTIVDDGDLTPSTTNQATHTFTSQTSTGPHTFLLVTWRDNNTASLDTYTWGGVSMTPLINRNVPVSDECGAAIFYISGAQSGTISLGFSESVTPVCATKVSLDNLLSATAIDTDFEELGSGTTATLDGLTTPGDGGIRLAVCANRTGGTAITWTNGTEIADLSSGGGVPIRHTVAYDLGDDGTSITAAGANAAHIIVGVSLR